MIQRRAYIKRSRPVRASVGGIPRKGIARHVRIAARNVKRHKTEWARAYHSAARVAFVKSLPCAFTGEDGYPLRENAHTVSGGMGRKGPYTSIIPATREVHRLAHRKGWRYVLTAYPNTRLVVLSDDATASVRDVLAALAADTEQRWQHFAGSTPSGAR